MISQQMCRGGLMSCWQTGAVDSGSHRGLAQGSRYQDAASSRIAPVQAVYRTITLSRL